jgi:hypothetical protein
MKKKHDIDEKRAVQSLSEMLQFKTVSYRDTSKMDEKVFKDLELMYKRDIQKRLKSCNYIQNMNVVCFLK